MTVRKAHPGDAETIRDLINLAFRIEKFFVDGDRISLAEVRSHFDTGEFLVASAGNGAPPAGCAYIERSGERAYLGLLSVDPAYQRAGLGAQLAAAAEQRCRDLGCRFMDLHIVNLRAELGPYYRRLGYLETGTEPFPADVPTRLPCHFVKMSKPL